MFPKSYRISQYEDTELFLYVLLHQPGIHEGAIFACPFLTVDTLQKLVPQKLWTQIPCPSNAQDESYSIAVILSRNL